MLYELLKNYRFRLTSLYRLSAIGLLRKMYDVRIKVLWSLHSDVRVLNNCVSHQLAYYQKINRHYG